MRLISDGHKVILKGNLPDCDKDLLQYAISSYSFVNGIRFDVSMDEWADNIKKTYNNNPRNRAVLYLIYSL